MKKDRLHQFVSLRDQLLREKAELVSRLSEINQALGEERAMTAAAAVAHPAVRRGRQPKKTAGSSSTPPRTGRGRARNKQSLRDAVLAATKSRPLSRQDLLKAVQAGGYVFKAKDPLNSLSTLLYSDKGIRNTNGRFGPA